MIINHDLFIFIQFLYIETTWLGCGWCFFLGFFWKKTPKKFKKPRNPKKNPKTHNDNVPANLPERLPEHCLEFIGDLNKFQGVGDGGNRGYRAVAVTLGLGEEWSTIWQLMSLHVQGKREHFVRLYGVYGYHELLHRIQWKNGSAPVDHWFNSGTAVVAADMLQRRVVILGDQRTYSVTYLPYNTESFNPTPVTLKHVASIHWGAAFLKPQFLPLLDLQWRQIVGGKRRTRPDLLPLYEQIHEALQGWIDVYVHLLLGYFFF